MSILVLCILGLFDSGKAQDIDLDDEIILTLEKLYKDSGSTLVDVDIDGSHNGPRENLCPPVKMYDTRVVFQGGTSVEQNGATALDEWYHNGQKKESLHVQLSQETERTTTVTTQVLKGVRTTLKGHVSAQIPASEGLGVALKAGTGLDIVIDIRTRTTKTTSESETFKVQDTFTVKPQKSVHVLWVIVESKMMVSWTATVTLNGFVKVWFKRSNGQTDYSCEHICNFYNYGMKDLVQLNATYCGVTVSGTTKVEGGVDSKIAVTERPLKYRSRPSIP